MYCMIMIDRTYRCSKMARFDRLISVPREKVIRTSQARDLFSCLICETFIVVTAWTQMRSLK